MPVDLQRRVSDVCCYAGGIRAAAKALGIEFSYLSRLANGTKTNPSDEVLAKLGLRRVVTYELVTRTRGVPESRQTTLPQSPTDSKEGA